MGMTLQQMRDGLREMLGVDENDEGFDDAGVDLLLNRSWWEISAMFKFKERETSRSDNTVAGTNTIALQAAAESIELVSVKDLYSDMYTPLEEIDIRDYETNYVDRVEARGKPTHFMRRAGNIILWPTPDDVYVVKTYYLATLSDIASAGVDIPQEWDEVIMYGGGWRGAVQLGDSNKKRLLKDTQMELLGTKETVDVKEKMNREYSGVLAMRPRYR